MNKDRKFIWTSIFTAIGASLCCITPLLAIVSGVSGFASAFSWLEPLRPYLIGVTAFVLGFAWYQKLKPKKEIECDCEENEKPKFLQTKLFLGFVTGFAILMLAFPYYGNVFYPNNEKEVIVIDNTNVEIVEISISGMTCDACQKHVNHAVNELPGIINVNTSYSGSNSQIEFDKSKTNIAEIEKAVNSTGYKVININ